MFGSGNNSVSISVSEDDIDELSRARARVRRKRKKPSHQLNNGFPRQLLRFLLRYWTVLIILLAAGLLLFEATRISRKPGPILKEPHLMEKSKSNTVTKPSTNKKTENNLNRLDPTTRVIGGVRERKRFLNSICLN